MLGHDARSRCSPHASDTRRRLDSGRAASFAMRDKEGETPGSALQGRTEQRAYTKYGELRKYGQTPLPGCRRSPWRRDGNNPKREPSATPLDPTGFCTSCEGHGSIENGLQAPAPLSRPETQFRATGREFRMRCFRWEPRPHAPTHPPARTSWPEEGALRSSGEGHYAVREKGTTQLGSGGATDFHHPRADIENVLTHINRVASMCILVNNCLAQFDGLQRNTHSSFKRGGPSFTPRPRRRRKPFVHERVTDGHRRATAAHAVRTHKPIAREHLLLPPTEGARRASNVGRRRGTRASVQM